MARFTKRFEVRVNGERQTVLAINPDKALIKAWQGHKHIMFGDFMKIATARELP